MRDCAELIKGLRHCSCAVHEGRVVCDGCPFDDDCAAAEFDIDHAAADAIEELLAKMPTWISVEERLPHYLDYVLCVNKFGIQMVGYLTDYKEGGFRCESGMDSCDYITHWMPLPEPPKGEVEPIAPPKGVE